MDIMYQTKTISDSLVSEKFKELEKFVSSKKEYYREGLKRFFRFQLARLKLSFRPIQGYNIKERHLKNYVDYWAYRNLFKSESENSNADYIHRYLTSTLDELYLLHDQMNKIDERLINYLKKVINDKLNVFSTFKPTEKLKEPRFFKFHYLHIISLGFIYEKDFENVELYRNKYLALEKYKFHHELKFYDVYYFENLYKNATKNKKQSIKSTETVKK